MTPDATRSAGRARITDPRAPRRWVVPLAIVVLVLGTLGAGAWLLGLTEGAVNRTALADEPKGVTVTPARAAQYRATRRYVGTLEPWQEARIGPQLASGFVDTVLVRPGAFAKRGDVLATLDSKRLRGEPVIGTKPRLEPTEGAAREAARLNELLDGGFAAPNEVEQKLAQSAAHEAQIQALLAQASGKSLEVRDCVLRAPFDSEVAARFADPGTFVRPGTPIVQLVDRSVVRLTAFVPEIDFDVVPPRTNVKLRVRATGKELTGEIARRSPAADTSTRTVRVEIDLASATRELPVGTTAEITVDVGAPVDAIEVPLVAAQIRGKRAALFVIEGSTAKKVTVDVLGERDGSLFVGTALAPDTHVVTQGRSLLAEGDRVTTKVDGPPSGRDGGAPATPTSAGERAEPPPERPSRSGPP